MKPGRNASPQEASPEDEQSGFIKGSAAHRCVYFNDCRSGSCVKASREGGAATTVSPGEVHVEVEAVHEVEERRRPLPSPAQTEPQQLVATGTQLEMGVSQPDLDFVCRRLVFSHQMKAVTVEVRLKIKQNEMYHRYLLQVLFTPATQAARQAACTIVEALTTIPSRKQQVLDLLTR